jgi:hypothetical protein
MRQWNSILILGILIVVSACTPLGQQNTPTAAKTNTASPTSPNTPEPSETPVPTSTPLPTATPTPEPIKGPLYSWPIPPLTEEQIQEVLDCQNATWSGNVQINPAEIEIENPLTSCDFALKALSMVVDSDTLVLPDSGIYYAQQALLINPGIIFANPYFFFAFVEIEIAGSPIPAGQIVEEIKINYTWSGIGAPVNYSVAITNEGTPLAVGSVEIGHGIGEDESTQTSWTFQKELAPEFLAGIGSSLVNLIPVHRQGMMYACFDNYPNWVVEIIFDDGEQLDLSSNWSNFYMEGGPFQTRLEGQNYVMATHEFNIALNKIIDKLELPYGETMAMYCNPFPVAEGLFTDLPIPDYFP